MNRSKIQKAMTLGGVYRSGRHPRAHTEAGSRFGHRWGKKGPTLRDFRKGAAA